MFETLLELPLFKGVSRNRITETVGKIRFDFTKYSPGAEIIRPGEHCDCLKFIVSGEVRVILSNEKTGFSVSETLAGPNVVLPDFFFGMTTDYPCRVVALSGTSVLEVEKTEYLKILRLDEVFLLNYLNYLSTNAQKSVFGVMDMSGGGLNEFIRFAVKALSQPSGRNIEMSCSRASLASCFGVEEADFEANVKSMADAGLVSYEDGVLRVLDRKRLLSAN